MIEFSAQLDIDIDEWEKHTPDQRRIMRLEERLELAVDHANKLVDSHRGLEQRLARLEAIITAGPRPV